MQRTLVIMIHVGAIAASLGFVGVEPYTQTKPSTSPIRTVRDVDRHFNEQRTRLEREYERQLDALQQGRLDQLRSLQDRAMEERDVDLVVEIREKIQAIEAETKPAPGDSGLTGVWQGRPGTFWVRQIADEVWWLSTSADEGQTHTHVFYGKLADNELTGRLADVPAGKSRRQSSFTGKLIRKDGEVSAIECVETYFPSGGQASYTLNRAKSKD